MPPAPAGSAQLQLEGGLIDDEAELAHDVHLDQVVGFERAACGHEVDDCVGQAHQRRDHRWGRDDQRRSGLALIPRWWWLSVAQCLGGAGGAEVLNERLPVSMQAIHTADQGRVARAFSGSAGASLGDPRCMHNPQAVSGLRPI